MCSERIALISDIHGNLTALEAVVEDISSHRRLPRAAVEKGLHHVELWVAALDAVDRG